MRSEKDHIRLRHMLDAVVKIVAFTDGASEAAFRSDEKLQLAVVRLLEIAGEAASGISETLKQEHAEIPWTQITATRNRLIHGYFDVDLAIVWKIVTDDIPSLAENLRRIV